MKRTLQFLMALVIVMHLALNARSQQFPAASSGDTANNPYWIQMMQDPDANFHATQSAFEKYWASRPNIRHNGWKVFKRWEYINESRVQPNGKLQKPDHLMKEMLRYRSSHAPVSVGGNWTILGPSTLPANATSQPNGMGRINAIALHPTNSNIIYIGSPSGALWKSSDGGSTWTVLIANLPSIGVSAVLLHPTDANLILIGTGDRDAGDAPGIGVYKSTDGGSNWTASNSGMGNRTVGMLIRNPSDASMILAATSGGIYKSTDGGSTWSLKSSSANFKDIRFKPGDPTTVYATEGGRFYKSTNTGDTWTQITAGVISGNRLVIGVSVNQPTWVYLLQTNGPFAGLLKSTNSGTSFTTQSTSPNIMDYACDGSGGNSQAWYDLCIAVDPNNANTIYTGGVNIWKSTNGGVNWTINSHWVGSSWGVSCAPSVHADIHCFEWSPVNNTTLYTGCDGGIYYTTNGGTAWNDISSGLAIAQVYKIGQSATNQGLTINGYQDNGTATNQGTSFTTVIGGDGMECIIDYSNSNIRYGELYYGSIRRTTGSGYSQIAGNGTNGITESGGWITPYILHETTPSTMYVGYKNLWRSTNVTASSPSSVSWTKITNGWTSNLTVLEMSPANNDILYVVSSGSLQRTDDASAATPTWTTCTLPGGTTPSDLEAHPTDANIVYATAGYNVYKSTNKGASWTSITGSLPSVYINTLVYDKNSNEGIYIGNQTGVWYKDATLSDWVTFNSGLPTVDVRELEIYYDASNASNNRLKAATYGRGLWESDLFVAFTIVPANQDVPNTAGSTGFTITTLPALTWTTTSDAGWCTVPSGGTGSGTLTANYTDNPTTSQRIATITVAPSGQPNATVTVTQAAGNPTLAVVPGNQDVSAAAGSTSFTVTSNSSWTAVSDVSWCTVTSSGTGDGTITANYEENLSVTMRVATITVTVSGLSPVTVTVTQSGAAPILNVSPNNQNVPYTAGNTSFTVISNTSWTVSSDASWCTVTPSGSGNGTIIADFTENPTHFQRIANISVVVSGLSPSTVTVTQAQSTVGTEDLSQGDIRIYPNPTKGIFRLIPAGGKTISLDITVNDLNAKTVYNHLFQGEKEYTVDLSSLPQGTYSIILVTGEQTVVKKLVILK